MHPAFKGVTIVLKKRFGHICGQGLSCRYWT